MALDKETESDMSEMPNKKKEKSDQAAKGWKKAKGMSLALDEETKSDMSEMPNKKKAKVTRLQRDGRKQRVHLCPWTWRQRQKCPRSPTNTM